MSFALRQIRPLSRTLQSSECSLQSQLQRRGMAAGASAASPLLQMVAASALQCQLLLSSSPVLTL